MEVKNRNSGYDRLFVLVVLLASPCLGQATRTWVSGVGDDANPCSRTAPCKTFAGAISKTAAGGEIDALDPGGYGVVTITKAITIDGRGTNASILSAGTNGVVVSAGATDVVTLRNLSINGAGTGLNGVRFISGGSLVVQNVDILGCTQRAVDFVSSGASKMLLSGVSIRNNTNGILVQPTVTGSASVMMNNVTMEHNSSYGLRVEDRSNVVARDSVASGNLNNGFLAISVGGGTAILTLERSTASGNRNATSNGSGIQSNGAQAVVRLSDVTVTNNDIGLNLANSGGIASWSNNHITSNTSSGSPTMLIGLQ